MLCIVYFFWIHLGYSPITKKIIFEVSRHVLGVVRSRCIFDCDTSCTSTAIVHALQWFDRYRYSLNVQYRMYICDIFIIFTFSFGLFFTYFLFCSSFSFFIFFFQVFSGCFQFFSKKLSPEIWQNNCIKIPIICHESK